jgi:hypothetical protein
LARALRLAPSGNLLPDSNIIRNYRAFKSIGAV